MEQTKHGISVKRRIYSFPMKGESRAEAICRSFRQYTLVDWAKYNKVLSMRSLQSKEQNVQSATKMDFLITHIPPEGILDEGRGSLPLLLEVYRSQPRFHVFGHAHSCGNQSKGGAFTEFYNVSQFNELKNQDGGQ